MFVLVGIIMGQPVKPKTAKAKIDHLDFSGSFLTSGKPCESAWPELWDRWAPNRAWDECDLWLSFHVVVDVSSRVSWFLCFSLFFYVSWFLVNNLNGAFHTGGSKKKFVGIEATSWSSTKSQDVDSWRCPSVAFTPGPAVSWPWPFRWVVCWTGANTFSVKHVTFTVVGEIVGASWEILELHEQELLFIPYSAAISVLSYTPFIRKLRLEVVKGAWSCSKRPWSHC